jgi:hypothetical protein
MTIYFREHHWKPEQMHVSAVNATRTVYVKRCNYDGSYAADTFFSVPAFIRIKGKRITGYATGRDDAPGMEFRVHNAHRAALLAAYGKEA